MRLLEVYQSDSDGPSYWIPLDEIRGRKSIPAGFYRNDPPFDYLTIERTGGLGYWIDNGLITRVRKPL